MSIFSRLFEFLERTAEAPPAAPVAKASPQGWTDEEPAWPPPEAAGTPVPRRFAGPCQVVDRLGEVLARQREAEAQRDEGYGRKLEETNRDAADFLRCLQLSPEELRRRKGSYARLVTLLDEHLQAFPGMVTRAVLSTYMTHLVEDLLGSGDEGLQAEGERLQRRLEAAWEAVREQRAAREAFPPPAPAEAEAALRLLLVECLEDGKLSLDEAGALEGLRFCLRVPPERFVELRDEVRAGVEAGEIAGSEEMSPPAFFARLLRHFLEDDVLSIDESRVVVLVADFLRLSEEEVTATRQRALAEHLA